FLFGSGDNLAPILLGCGVNPSLLGGTLGFGGSANLGDFAVQATEAALDFRQPTIGIFTGATSFFDALSDGSRASPKSLWKLRPPYPHDQGGDNQEIGNPCNPI